MSSRTFNKIICAGLHKTGTTTLHVALEKLGFSVCSARPHLTEDLAEDNWLSTFEIADLYDAVQDDPWPYLYKELDKKYPNSKFILTVRDEKKWIASNVKNFGGKDLPWRKYFYGVGDPLGNEDLYIEKYLNHNAEVKDYFSNRKDDLLVMSLENDFGWDKLCPFLGLSIPDFAFPHANKSPKNGIERKYNVLKGKLYRFLFGTPAIMSKKEKEVRGLDK